MAETLRPPVFAPVQVPQVKALACPPPADSDLPLARWSSAELAVESIAQGMIASIKPEHDPPVVGQGRDQTLASRVLDLPRDPHFAAKAAAVLDLYDRRWQGVELGDNQYVISADE